MTSQVKEPTCIKCDGEIVDSTVEEEKAADEGLCLDCYRLEHGDEEED